MTVQRYKPIGYRRILIADWCVGLPANHEVPSSKPALVTGSVFSALSIAVMQASTILQAMNCADTHGALGTHLLGVRVTRMRFVGVKCLYMPTL